MDTTTGETSDGGGGGATSSMDDEARAVIIRTTADDHDDEREEDDWSRHVETDQDTTMGGLDPLIPIQVSDVGAATTTMTQQQHRHQGASSTASSTGAGGGGGGDISDDRRNRAAAALLTSSPRPPVVVAPPMNQRELTMKEKLVLRERERRIETERARLKRQFALSNGDVISDDEEDEDGRAQHGHHHGNNESGGHHHDQRPSSGGGGGGGGGHAHAGGPTTGPTDPTQTRNGAGGGGGGGSSAPSIEGTLGEESTIVHCDEDSTADPLVESRLGLTMERFLTTQANTAGGGSGVGGIASSSSSMIPPPPSRVNATASQNNSDVIPVAMERFLNDPVVPTPPPASVGRRDAAADDDPGSHSQRQQQQPTAAYVQRSVSFDVGGGTDGAATVPLTPRRGERDNDVASADSYHDETCVSDVSVVVEAPSTPVRSVLGTSDTMINSAEEDILFAASETNADFSPSVVAAQQEEVSVDDEPRVLRLTEADMQEMAAIEEASIGNAPPSDREEEDLVGELADFGRGNLDSIGGGPGTNISLDTPTTAMESASLMSETPSGQGDERTAGSGEHHSFEGIPTGSVSSHLIVSPSASANNDSVAAAANPPSVVGGSARVDDVPPSPILDLSAIRAGDALNTAMAAPQIPASNELGEANEGIENRRIRPGMVEVLPPPRRHRPDHQTTEPAEGGTGVVVEGFDFDKDHPSSPIPPHQDNDSFRELPGESPWSPSANRQLMHISPLRDARANHFMDRQTGLPKDDGPPEMPFGNSDDSLAALKPQSLPTNIGLLDEGEGNSAIRREAGEATPLLSDIPPEIVTPTRKRNAHSHDDVNDRMHRSPRSSLFNRQSLRPALSSVFSEIRSESDCENEEIHNESEFYLRSSTIARACPERLFALTVTLLFEIPVLLMISGGSDALCGLIGRRRYQLLMGFLPLTSAISGNVGLQASTLTTRAISHLHVTKNNYMGWLLTEIGAAAYLGVGMGCILGAIAFVASGMDVPFGLTIFLAQIISILTAGCTGTLAPLIFSFIFARDSGKWGGPLETAVQDIVGSFAMVVVSYQILKLMGPGPISPDDVCGVDDADSLDR